MVLEAKRLLLREMNPDDYASEGMVLGLLVGSEIKKKSDNDKGGKTE